MVNVAQLWAALADAESPPLITGSHVVMLELMDPDGVPAEFLGFFCDEMSARHVAAQFVYAQILDGHMLPPWADPGDPEECVGHYYVYPPDEVREVRERDGRQWLTAQDDPVQALLFHHETYGYFDVVFTRAQVQGAPDGPLSMQAALA